MGDDEFFPPILPPPPHPRPEQPEWFGPPAEVLGRSVGIDAIVLARTDQLALVVDCVRAYPNGVAFTLTAIARGDQELHDLMGHPRPGDRLDPEDMLRVGVELSDGRRAIEMPPWGGHGGDRPASPVLRRGRGGGGGSRYDFEYWLWPLPPRGALTFVCRWRARGVPLSRHTISADPIVDLAAQAKRIWED